MRDPDFQELDLDFVNNPADLKEPKPDLWQRLSRVMEVVLYILVMAVVVKYFWPEIKHQNELNGQLAEIQEFITEKESQVQLLQQQAEWLKTDTEYREAIARDRLNLFRPAAGEFIVRIERDAIDENTGAEATPELESPLRKVRSLKPSED